MKDYGSLIIWSDYFNSALSRSERRRVPLHTSVRNPGLKELEEAAARLGYSPAAHPAAHPKRSLTPSGYISIEKKKAKSVAVKEIARALVALRGEQRQSAEAEG